MHGSIPVRQRWQEAFDFLKEVYVRFAEDRISLAAGAITYFMLLSLFPLLLLVVTFAAQGFNAQLANLQSTLGPVIYDALQTQVISVVKNRGLSTAVALIFGLWSGSQVFIIVESAMNLAWHATRKRPFWIRRGLAMFMVVIVGTLLTGAILLANLIRFLASLEIPLWGHRASELPWLVTSLITIVVPVLLISAIFAVMYRVLPTKRVTLRTVLPGAMIAGVLWLLSLHVFGWYTANIARYQVFYGSLGGLVLLLIWFYYSAFTLLLGAEISAAYHHRLVEAGDSEERLVEESDGLSVVAAGQHFGTPSAENALASKAYYGYQHEE